MFLHLSSAQTSSGIEPQDFTTPYLKYFILSRNGHWCPSWKEFTILLHFKTSQKDANIGSPYITILHHSHPTLIKGLQGAEAAACIHAARARVEPHSHSPPAQNCAALNHSFFLPGREDGHSTQQWATRILEECCAEQPSWCLSGS